MGHTGESPEPLLAELHSLRQRVEHLESMEQKYHWAEVERLRLLAALEAAGEAIMITATDGTIQYVNAAFERITGYTRAEVLEKNPRLLRSGKHDRAFYQQMWQTLRRGDVWRGVLINRKKDGTLFEAEKTIAPVRDASGTISGFIAVERDMTTYRDLERQLRQTQKMQAIGTLASGIAHDFNNILAAILGYTELALHDVSEETAAWHYLQQVFIAGQRAKELVQQILTFSRQGEQERKPVQLHPLIKETLNLVRTSLPATITVRYDLDPQAGTVLADPTQMHQVLLNLYTNAAYAMRASGGLLAVRLEPVELTPETLPAPDLSPGSYVCLRVQDTGEGITPEIRERIFEPFFTTKPVGEGTGMGLAVTHGIVTSHGGSITVESLPGQGTTFSVYLPRCAKTLSPEDDPVEEPPHGNECILFVDDEAPLAQLGQEMLARLGYRVVARTSSIEALEAFRAAPHRYDLVITDQTMPNMTGETLARELRSIRSDIPIILCTGFSHALTSEQATTLGINALVHKPLVMRDLAATIRRVLASPRLHCGS